MKKIVSILVVVAMLLSMAPAVFAADSAQVTEIYLGNTAYTDWAQVAEIYTTNWGGALDPYFMTEGGYLSIYVTGTDLWSVHYAMNGAAWTQIDKEVGTATMLDDGSYVFTISYDEVVAAYGSDFSTLGAVYVYTNSAADVTVTSVTWTAAAEESTGPNGSEEDPFILDSLPADITGTFASDLEAELGHYYVVTMTESGTVDVAEGWSGCLVAFMVNGEWTDAPLSVQAGDVVTINPWYFFASDYSLSVTFEAGEVGEEEEEEVYGTLEDGDNYMELPSSWDSVTYKYTATQTGTLYICATYLGWDSEGSGEYSDDTEYMADDFAWYCPLTVDGLALENGYYGAIEVTEGETYTFVWTDESWDGSWGWETFLNLSYTDELIPVLGSENLPVELNAYWDVIPCETIEIAAGGTAYYSLMGFGGMTVTVTGEGAYILMSSYDWSTDTVIYTKYEAVDGVASVTISSMGWGATTIQIGNDSETAQTYILDASYPEGSYDNPADLVHGENSAEVGQYEYYYWDYTAEEDVTLYLALNNEMYVDWYISYDISHVDGSVTYGPSSWYGGEGEEGASSYVVTLTAGDYLVVYTGDYATGAATTAYLDVHMLQTVVTEGNCMDKGCVSLSCTECDFAASVEEGEYGDHMIAIVYPGVDATCIEEGILPYWYCGACGKIFADEDCTVELSWTDIYTEVNPSNHYEIIHVEAKEPTCFEEGNIEYWYCPDCGYAWLDENCMLNTNLLSVILPTKEHTIEHVEAKEPNCYEEGNIEYWYCTDCGYAWLDEDCTLNTNLLSVILPVSHNIEHVEAKEATCLENGNIEYWYCTECGFAWLDELCHLNTNLMSVVTPATGHEYVDCVCVHCGDTIVEKEVAYVNIYVGDNTVTLLGGVQTTIFFFLPSETGVYEVTINTGDTLSLWSGSEVYVGGDITSSDIYNAETNTLTLTYSAVTEGSTVGLIGVTGSGEVTITITRVGDAPVDVSDMEWTEYVNDNVPTGYEDDSCAAITWVDIAGSHTAVLGEDGYYHLDSADGDIILVNLSTAGNLYGVDLTGAVAEGRVRAYVYDDEGNLVAKVDYNAAMSAYLDAASEDGWVYLTEDLIQIFQNYGASQGWYDPDLSFHLGGVEFDPETAWMLCCATLSPGHNYVDGVCANCGGVAVAAPVVTASNLPVSGKIHLTWDAVEGAVKYMVYRADSKNGEYKLMFTTTKTSYTNTKADAGDRYYYYVVAVNADDITSAASNTVGRTCDLAQPVVEASNVSTSGAVKLTWNAVEGAVKYRVYRATSKNGEYELMYTTTKTSYTNTKAEAGVTYYYKVVAVAENTAANSAASAVVRRTCDLARPTVTASLTKGGKPKLTWNAVEGAVKYRVYRATSKNGEYKLVFTTTKTSFTNTGATAGVTYYYKVVAVAENTAANSAASNIVHKTAK